MPEDIKDNDQLLEDASTLLMFANVAAKYQQEQSKRKTPPLPNVSRSAVSNTRIAKDEYVAGKQAEYLTSRNSTIPQARSIYEQHNNYTGPVYYARAPQVTVNDSYGSMHAPIVAGNTTSMHHDVSGIHQQQKTTPKEEPKADPHGHNEVMPEVSVVPSDNVRTSDSPSQHTSTNLTLARGIDPNSGKRSVDNAIIAAAALAAAADIPLPLIKHSQDTKVPDIVDEGYKERETKEATGETNKSHFKVTDLITQDENEDLAPKNAVKKEDTVFELGAKDDQPEKTASSKMNIHSLVSKDTVKDKSKVDDSKLGFSVPSLDSYRVSPESGLIGCICGIEDDDGFTIQCDICFRWQHCLCMGYKSNDEIPDVYKCYYCDEDKWNKYDPELCRITTIKRLEGDKNENNEIKLSNKRKRQFSEQKVEDKKKKKRKVENSTSISQKSPKDTNFKFQKEDAPLVIHNENNEFLEEGVTAEVYQNTYCSTDDILMRDISTNNALSSYLQSSIEYHMPTNQKIKSLNKVSNEKYQNFKYCKLLRKNLVNHSIKSGKSFSNNKTNKWTLEVRPYSDNNKQKFNGITKFGLFIFCKGMDSDDEMLIPKGTKILEYTGELLLFEKYIAKNENQYSHMGCLKPHIVKVCLDDNRSRSESLDFVVDARSMGNESRFIRKSCDLSSNCEVQPFLVQDNNELKFVVLTSKDIILRPNAPAEELKLPWEWDDDHPINKISLNSDDHNFDEFTEAEKSYLINSIDHVSNLAECACKKSGKDQIYCLIFRIKKYISNILRTNRKSFGLSNVNLSKTREDLVIMKPSYNSWKSRLQERNKEIAISLNVDSLSESCNLNDGGSETKLKVLNDGAEVSQNDTTKKLYFETPILKQIISKFQSRKQFEITDTDDNYNVNFIDNSFITVGLNETIMSKILSSVDKEFHLYQEPINQRSEVSVASESKKKQDDSMENFHDDEIKTRKDAENSHSLPMKPVKKLSFADYMKKMK